MFGGRPSFAEPLHVGKPALPRRPQLAARFASILEREWLTNDGPLVREFEERVAALVGARHCIAMANGTVAIEVLLRTLDLDGEVIVPAFTFVATAHAARWLGLTPVFADVDPATHNIDPAEAALLVNERTAAILGVHLWGRPCAVDQLAALAQRHGVPLLFDAAHAFGCSYGAARIGNFGVAEVFSFHATKFVTTGEGGAVLTNDDDLAKRLRLMRNFGFAGIDKVVSLGTNAKMSEFSAAVGLTSLDGMPDVIAANQERYERYRSQFVRMPRLSLAQYDPRLTPNYQYVVAEVALEEGGISRDDLVSVLRAENVLARRYFFPGCHRVEPYRHDALRRPVPATEMLAASVVALPTGINVSEKAVDTVTALLAYVFENEHEVASLLRAAARD